MNDTRERIVAGRYVLGELLGAGGMGAVYRAQDRRHGAEVAVKLLHAHHRSNGLVRRHFQREGSVCRDVRHPNVVMVLDAGTSQDGMPFVVMEYLRGQQLATLLRTEGPPSLARAVAIVQQILKGLAILHQAGVVHGDVKSDNVLVTSVDGVEVVKLIDLGLARRANTLGELPEEVASGTPEYMAPEVIRCEGSIPASDIYAVGVILYELVTGSTPFGGGTSQAILARHLHDDVVPPSLRCPDRSIPLALEQAIMVALEKDPALRHASAEAFAEALVSAAPTAEPATQRGEACAFSYDGPTRDWSLHELPARRSLTRLPSPKQPSPNTLLLL